MVFALSMIVELNCTAELPLPEAPNTPVCTLVKAIFYSIQNHEISKSDAITSTEPLALVVTLRTSAACKTTFWSPPIGTRVDPVIIGALDIIEKSTAERVRNTFAVTVPADLLDIVIPINVVCVADGQV
jgi:hypothetical protein